VAPANPVRVEHRHEFEHKLVPQFLAVLVVLTEQELEQPQEGPLPRELPWMNPRTE